MADTVAGLGEDRSVAARGGLEVAVVVGVARVHLVDVVVDVGDDARRHDAREAHGLELEPRHRAVRVGEERLVHGQTDLLAGDGLARGEVRFDELPGEASVHCSEGRRQAGAIGGWPETRHKPVAFRMSLFIPRGRSGWPASGTLLHRHERAPLRADVLAARPDGRPPGSPEGGTPSDAAWWRSPPRRPRPRSLPPPSP